MFEVQFGGSTVVNFFPEVCRSVQVCVAGLSLGRPDLVVHIQLMLLCWRGGGSPCGTALSPAALHASRLAPNSSPPVPQCMCVREYCDAVMPLDFPSTETLRQW